jgi:hypothetical protein
MFTAAKVQDRTRRLLHALLALTLGFFALSASNSAWADPPGRVGRIASFDGNVWLFDDEQQEWVQARRNRPLTEGDRLSAERGARAEVQIGSGTLRLDGATDIEFAQLDDSRVHVRVLGGSVALRVRGQSAREFALVTQEGRYEPLRPGHYRVDVEERSSVGETLAGAMRFEAQDSVLEISDGQRAEFWQERGVTHYSWSGQSSDRFGDWVAREDREDTRDRNRYVSDEMTGADDLDRHGRWDRHPEYGAVWYPTVVTAGWAPYRYGHWAYVRPWGWTWVDDAPWGFAPFHYGRWVNYGGRWGWCPGQYVARPVYAPALVAWFGGPNVRVGVSVGGGPAVGWVPLAPREIYYPGYYHSPHYVRGVNRTHERWYGPNPRYERPVPTGPVMYTNQGVAGGVTVVPQNVMQGRQPISSRVVMPVDGRTVAGWQSNVGDGGGRGGLVKTPPPAPAARVVATPGGAVPAAPNAARNANWGRVAPRVSAAQGDGGQAPLSRTVTAPTVTPAAPVVPIAPQVQGVPSPQPRVRDGRDTREERRDERRDDRRGERRVVTPQQLPQGAPMSAPERQWQRVEPPQVRPVQPGAVVPPPQTRPPAVRQDNDAGGPQPQRGGVVRGIEPREQREQPRMNPNNNNGNGQRSEERVWRGRDPRDNQQVR